LHGLLGVSFVDPVVDGKDPLRAFSCGHFRSDITPERVVDLLRGVPPQNQAFFLMELGFNENEARVAVDALPGSKLLMELKEIQGLSASTTTTTSCAREVLAELLDYSMGGIPADVFETIPMMRPTLLHVLLCMLYDFINIATVAQSDEWILPSLQLVAY
jgi:hypothetical protein